MTLHWLRRDPSKPLAERSEFGRDLWQALRQRPRRIAPKYFYDARGSALFDAICELPEYYPTRTEIALLARHAREIAQLIGPGVELVEPGAGASRKVRILLEALALPARFLPIDISGEHLQQAASALRAQHPALEVHPVVADYTAGFDLPPARGRRVGFYPGSSIGNFEPHEARELLAGMARWADGGLLVGVDLVKDPEVLHAAYNDAQGITAAFNLNLLARANRELGADFNLSGFHHHALYQPMHRRIEMHLVSRRAQTVTLFGERFHFDEGESLQTENSYKYTLEGFQALARGAGFVPRAAWTDEARRFSLHWLVPVPVAAP